MEINSLGGELNSEIGVSGFWNGGDREARLGVDLQIDALGARIDAELQQSTRAVEAYDLERVGL